jgi:hypothetical protein
LPPQLNSYGPDEGIVNAAKFKNRVHYRRQPCPHRFKAVLDELGGLAKWQVLVIEEKIVIGEEKTTEVSIVPNGILTCPECKSWQDIRWIRYFKRGRAMADPAFTLKSLVNRSCNS